MAMKQKQKVVAIIQARMTSTRLPGKVLLPLGDKTVLGQVLTRCHQIEGVDEVCCAVPIGEMHDCVAAEALKYQATIFRGSEHDVLERYYQAAQYTHADIIMRMTSDCPLIDPKVSAKVLQLFKDSNVEYACNNMPVSWPHGLDCEVFSFEALKTCYQQATAPEEREHVTKWIRNHYRCVNLENPMGNQYSLRITLDTPEDYEVIKSIFEKAPENQLINHAYLHAQHF